jgi:hypothetical protein
MQSGIDFLKVQVDNATTIHASLLESMNSHEAEANDARYRDLCERHLPHMREHQLMLEELRTVLGADNTGSNPPAEIAGAIRKAAGSAIGIARSLADAPMSDYERLASDLNLARQLEVVFKTFRDAGRTLRIDRLAKLGEVAERHHDDYSADAKRLLLQMFVERAQGASDIVRSVADSRADFRMS